MPPSARDIGQLRTLKKLTRISERWDLKIEGNAYDRGGPARTAEEYWKDFEAKKK